MYKKYKILLLSSLIILVSGKNTFARNWYPRQFASPILTKALNVKFSDTTANNTKPFIKQLLMTLRYPKKCRDKNVHGKVVIKFVITGNKRAQQIEPMQSPDDLLTDEVVNAINKAPVPAGMQQGTYTIAIEFVLNGLNDKDPDVKQYNYAPLPTNVINLSELMVTANVDN